MRRIVFGLLCAILLGFPVATVATSIKKLDFQEKIRRADRIFTAEIIKKHSYWNEDHSRILTDVTLKVTRKVTGKFTSGTIVITVLGGEIKEENVGLKVSGMPKFELGEEKLLFLDSNLKQYCPIIGWRQGAYKVFADPRTKRKWISHAARGRTLAKTSARGLCFSKHNVQRL